MLVSLKLVFGDDIRRISLHREELSLQALKNAATQIFGPSLPEVFAFKYTDSDGDSITVTTDIELEEALKNISLESSQNALLRLTIVEFVKKSLFMTQNQSTSSSSAVFHGSSLENQLPISSQEDSDLLSMIEQNISYPKLEPAHPMGTCTDSFDVDELKSAISHIADEAVRDAQSFFDRIVSGIRNFITPETEQINHPEMNLLASANNSILNSDKYVKDVTLEDGAEVPAGAELVKIWKVKNNSNSEWPVNTILKHTAGPLLSYTNNIHLESPVKPGAEIEISIRLVSPSELGRFVSHFRLQTPSGSFVGPRLWLDVQVVEFFSGEDFFGSGSFDEIKSNLQTLLLMGFERDRSIRALISHNNNLEEAINSLFQ